MNNYFDWFHYYPAVGDEMIAALQKPSQHKDIVKIVNNDSFRKYIGSVNKKKETQ